MPGGQSPARAVEEVAENDRTILPSELGLRYTNYGRIKP